MASLLCMARLPVFATLVTVVLLLLGGAEAHAHVRDTGDQGAKAAIVHSDAVEQSLAGDCHGEVSCAGGLHLVAVLGPLGGDTPTLPGPKRAKSSFREVAPSRDPPIPISLF
ncbi:hypothetical protein DYI42_07285 [Vannielia litorea]|nr:hypothetical protein [Vannielia litorea]